MNSSANVRSIAALEELRNALMRFKNEAQNTLHTVEGEINRTRAWLQERLTYWQNELKRRRRFLEEARAALAACEALAIAAAMASGGRAAPDCSGPQAAVLRAQRLVQEAEQELLNVQRYIKRVEEAIDSYQKQARRLTGALDEELLKGTALLSNSTHILESYIGMGGLASGTDIPTTAFTLTSPTTTNTFTSTAGYLGSADIQMVSVADIDLSDSHVTGVGDFGKGISPDDMIEGFHKLQSVVAPAVAQGAVADYFAQLDASLGLENANSYLNIYNIFYNENSCIRLDKVGDKYTVDNGYHRLFIARQLGIMTVPAKVFSR